MTKTDEEKLAERQRERELQALGLVRVETQIANLALRYSIPVERGPSIPGVPTDRGLYVPAWFQWYVERFPQNAVNQRERLEGVEGMKTNKDAQYVLLIEANLAGGTLYDPSGDIGTKAALDVLAKELGRPTES